MTGFAAAPVGQEKPVNKPKKLIESANTTAVDEVYLKQQSAAYAEAHLTKCSPDERSTFIELFEEGMHAGMNPGEIERAFRQDVKDANHRAWVARRSAKSPLAAKLVEARLVITR